MKVNIINIEHKPNVEVHPPRGQNTVPNYPRVHTVGSHRNGTKIKKTKCQSYQLSGHQGLSLYVGIIGAIVIICIVVNVSLFFSFFINIKYSEC